MSLGIYNDTYFRNNPEESDVPAILYCVVLVNIETMNRECIKIGIAKGTSWKDALKRAGGFKGYDIRIQKIVKGTLEEIYHLEQYLHEVWSHRRYIPKQKFGGWTELFEMDPEIIKSVPTSA